MSIRGKIIVAAVAGAWLGAVPVTGQTAHPVDAPAGQVVAEGSIVDTRPSVDPSGPATMPTRRSVASRPSRLTSRPATPPASTQPAVLRVDAAKHDFGKIWDSDTVEHTFEMVNMGRQAVTILNVHSSCGCTTTDKWEKEVAPGGVWKLPVKFVPAGRRGKTSKSVTVDTDDPGARQVVFQLEGEISPRFEMTPAPSVNFGLLRQEAQAKKTLSITNKGEEAASITSVKVDTELLKVAVREIEAGRTYELDVETVPPLKVSNIRGKITLETSLKEQPEVTVYAYGSVQPRVSLMPQMVLVPPSPDKQQRRRLVLKASEGVTVHVTDVKVSNPKILATVDTVREGQEYQIWLTLPAEVSLPAEGETITVTTDDAELPTLKAALRPYGGGRTRSPMGAATSLPSSSTQPETAEKLTR